MNKYFNKWIQFGCLALSLMVAACQSDTGLPETTINEEGVLLSFCVNNDLTANSRTALDPDENKDNATQHVEYVQLYVFEGTGDDAVCVSSENVKWADYFGTNLPTKTDQMNYRVKYKNFKDELIYTFLAVGLDDRAGTTYGLPASIEVDVTTLAEANATLGGMNSTDESGWTVIRESELFAGKSAFLPGSNETKTINLYRRVAGVIAWFKNVPEKIDGDPVKKIRVSLYKAQNKSVPLMPREQTPVFKDYIDNPLGEAVGSRTIFELEVPSDQTTNAFPGTSFMLPLPAPEAKGTEDYTMRVELESEKGYLRTFRVKLGNDDPLDSPTTGGTGIIDTESAYRFPIIANHIYQLGTRTSPIDFTGNEVMVMAKKWEEVNVEVVFPPAGLSAYFITNFNKDKYIFNCMNASVSTKDEGAKTITVVPSAVTTSWALKIPDDCDWLFFDEGDGGYVKAVSGTERKDIKLYFNDYAVKKSYTNWPNDIKDDYRTTTLELSQTGGTTKMIKLPIRQYNAITIDYYKNSGERTDAFAISRLDVGTYFDWDTGEVVRPEEHTVDLHQWGFFNTYYLTVYQSGGTRGGSNTDGQDNVQRMDDNNLSGIWVGSAAYYCNFSTSELDQSGNEKTNGRNSNKKARTMWYLPARYQNANMLFWYTYVVPNASKKYMNFRKHPSASADEYDTAQYWSSTAVSPQTYWTYYCQSGYSDGNESARKESWYSMRPARNFNVAK